MRRTKSNRNEEINQRHAKKSRNNRILSLMRRTKSKRDREKEFNHRRDVLPECNILSQFAISDQNITEFKRYVKKPMDCVINTLQIFGILDNISANIIRISCVGENGFTTEQIEKIFILVLGNKFHYKSITNYDDFVRIIEETLSPGYGVFAGYADTYGHVFIIARRLDGVIMMIDPQSNMICEINNCQNKIPRETTYFLLYHSPKKMSELQLKKLGFVFDNGINDDRNSRSTPTPLLENPKFMTNKNNSDGDIPISDIQQPFEPTGKITRPQTI